MYLDIYVSKNIKLMFLCVVCEGNTTEIINVESDALISKNTI